MKIVLSTAALLGIALFAGCGGDTTVKDPNAKEGTAVEQQQADQNSEVTTDQPEVEAIEETVVDGAEGTQGTDVSQQADIDMLQSKMKSVYFEFDKFNLRSDMREVVAQDADIIKSEAASHVVKVEGNCDEWGSDEYNYALGLKRASTVKKEMVNSGVDAANITLVSLGKSNPVCQEKTQDCWSKNRRVDIKILP